MTFVDGLSSTLAAIGQIQADISSLPAAPQGGGFASVLAQVAELSGSGLSGSGLSGSGLSGSGGGPGTAPGAQASTAATGNADLSGIYGWPLEEGEPLSPADGQAGGTTAGSGSAPLGTEGAAQMVAQGTEGGSSPASQQSLGQEAVAEAKTFLGVPYLWGGTNPAQGVDCSGLVQDVYAKLGIDLPRTSEQQATVGTAVQSLADAEPGDLVFFPGSDGTASSPGHVGIYIGNGEMIDAPHTGTDVQVGPVGAPTAIRRVTGLAGSPPGAPESTGAGAPSAYAADFAAASAASGVPAQLLEAVASTESGFQPTAVSGAGAEGLMQLMPSTASSLGVDPFDPSEAITGAAKLLSNYHAKYGSWSVALAAYNAGPGAVQEYSGIPPYAQTQAYVQTVLSRAGMVSAGMEGQ